jgi:hypothetical protein
MGILPSVLCRGGTFDATNINSDLPSGTTYYILTYDISSSAAIGETFDQKIIMANDMTFNSTNYNASTDDPAGFRKVGYCQPVFQYGIDEITNVTTIGSGIINNY